MNADLPPSDEPDFAATESLAADDRKNFWDAEPVRVRTPSRFYTRFVRSMRLILPLLAVGVIGLVMAWPQVDEAVAPARQAALEDGQTVSKNELIDPHFESFDKNERPFSLTADRAVQSAQDPDLILLENPKANLKLDEADTLYAEALNGAYRQNEDSLMLQEAVKFTHSQDYVLMTEKMLIDLKAQSAFTDLPVRAEGPAGTLDATGMSLHEETGELIFTGPATLVLTRGMKGL